MTDQQLKMIIGADRKGYDHFTLRWENSEGKIVGVGYKGKNGGYGLMVCPSCGKENYALNVISGNCSWCDFTIT